MSGRETIREYALGRLWVLPLVGAILAVIVAVSLERPEWSAGPLDFLAFHGSAADARSMLLAIAQTVVTVIALVMGLTVVALQQTSTQFSPRLLRNFLRDGPSQVSLSIMLGTFAYSGVLLFSVGVPPDPETFPRVAVNLALVLLFVSLGAVVYFAHHLLHSLQVEAIMRRVEGEALAVVRQPRTDVDLEPPTPPSWAVRIPAASSGYVQRIHPELLLPLAIEHEVGIALTTGVGQHISAPGPVAVVWTPSADDPKPNLRSIQVALAEAVGIGFERTTQQDSAFGIRQLVDVADKALSPAVNDPYTAVQAIHHMTVIFGEMAQVPLGPRVARDPNGPAVVLVPGRTFSQYLTKMSGLIRRYGSAEPSAMKALLQLMEHCADMARTDPARLTAISTQAALVVEDAVRDTRQPADVSAVIALEAQVQEQISAYRAALG